MNQSVLDVAASLQREFPGLKRGQALHLSALAAGYHSWAQVLRAAGQEKAPKTPAQARGELFAWGKARELALQAQRAWELTSAEGAQGPSSVFPPELPHVFGRPRWMGINARGESVFTDSRCVLAFGDSDLELPPELLPQLVDGLLEGAVVGMEYAFQGLGSGARTSWQVAQALGRPAQRWVMRGFSSVPISEMETPEGVQVIEFEPLESLRLALGRFPKRAEVIASALAAHLLQDEARRLGVRLPGLDAPFAPPSRAEGASQALVELWHQELTSSLMAAARIPGLGLLEFLLACWSVELMDAGAFPDSLLQKFVDALEPWRRTAPGYAVSRVAAQSLPGHWKDGHPLARVLEYRDALPLPAPAPGITALLTELHAAQGAAVMLCASRFDFDFTAPLSAFLLREACF